MPCAALISALTRVGDAAHRPEDIVKWLLGVFEGQVVQKKYCHD